jgi:putative transposase
MSREVLRNDWQVNEEDNAMTNPNTIDVEKLLADQLATASPDSPRGLLSTFVQALMSAEADAVCGTDYGQRSQGRANRRNGYRHRDLDTRAGTIDVAIPKLRPGSYFPEWLLQRRKHAECALTSVVANQLSAGSVNASDGTAGRIPWYGSLPKSPVSVMTAELDEAVDAFRTRPLDAGPYTFVAADALVLKVRENGRVVGVHTLIATGVNAGGYREILTAGVLRRRRGRLAGVLPRPGRPRPVRDCTGHQRRAPGLVAAISATLPAAAWQRCRTL